MANLVDKNRQDKNDLHSRPIALNAQSFAWDGIAANGIDLDDNTYKPNGTSTEVAKILAEYQKMATSGYLIPEYSPTYTGSNDKEYAKKGYGLMFNASRIFEEGKSAFTSGASWQTVWISKSATERNFDLRIVPWPQLNANKENYTSAVYEGALLGVTKGKQAPEVAEILLKINKAYLDSSKKQDIKHVREHYKEYEGKTDEEIANIPRNIIQAKDFVRENLPNLYQIRNTKKREKAIKEAVDVVSFLKEDKHIKPLYLIGTGEAFALAYAANRVVFGGEDYQEAINDELKDRDFKDNLIATLEKECK